MTTTGNEPAALLDTTSALAIAAGTQPAAPVEPAQVVTDVDDLELQAAHAAAKAEEAGAEAKPEATVPSAPAASATPTEPQPAVTPPVSQEPPVAPAMIPKPRLDEALGERDKARNDAAYWRGVAEARAQQPAQPAAAPAQPQETPEQKLAAIHTEIDALAKKFDDGEITMAEYKRQERDLSNREMAIREEGLIARVKPADTPPQQPNGDQLYLDRLTADLETTHPWVKVFDQVATQSDWAYLEGKARENLTERQFDMQQGAISTYELRKEIAALADAFGPSLLSERAKAKGIAIPGQQPTQPPAPATPQLSPNAQALKDKLDKQTQAPPNVAAMNGAVGSTPGEFSDAQLEAMSEDDIAALPAATRKRLLGIT